MHDAYGHGQIEMAKDFSRNKSQGDHLHYAMCCILLIDRVSPAGHQCADATRSSAKGRPMYLSDGQCPYAEIRASHPTDAVVT